MGDVEIPSGPEALTAAWLTAALRAGGALSAGHVRAFDLAPLDTGHGLTGQLVRVHLAYAGVAGEAPARLVAKFASATPELRARPNTREGYLREVRFYRELGSRTSLPTPRCYYADADPESGDHVLLLQDLAPARSGFAPGQVAEQAQRAVRQVAAFHADWWESPELAALTWIREPRATPAALDEARVGLLRAHQAWWPAFLARVGDALSEEMRALGERLGPLRADILHQLFFAPPRTLIHRDFAPANLMFATPQGGVPFAVVDWQFLARGRGTWDVAYLLLGVDPADRRALENGLLREYVAILAESGVRGYGPEACRFDYRLSLLQRFGALISTIAAMPFQPLQIQTLVDESLPRCTAALQDHAADEALEQVAALAGDR